MRVNLECLIWIFHVGTLKFEDRCALNPFILVLPSVFRKQRNLINPSGIFTRVYIYTCLYLHVFLFTRVYIYTCLYLHVFIFTRVYIYTCLYLHVFIFTRVSIYTCFYLHVFIFTRVYILVRFILHVYYIFVKCIKTEH